MTMIWRPPTADSRLATRRYLLRRRLYWEPVRLAALQHPDLPAMVAALFGFVTDGIIVHDDEHPAQPLLHRYFDQAWGLHADGPRYCERNGIDPAAGPTPLVAFLVIPTIHTVAAELAGVRLRRGVGVWSPQTGEPLRDWLPCHPGRVTLHHEPSELPQQARLRWRLYQHAVPERLRTLLDGTLPKVLSIRESDAADLAESQARLARYESQLSEC